MTAFALLFTMAALGIAETSYLMKKRKAAERPVCPIGGDCEKVLNSKYNKLFGAIHNDQLGHAYYIALAALTALIVLGYGDLALWASLVNYLVLLGAFMSLVLIFLMWRVIRAWCFWCLMSAGTIAVMGIILATKNFNLIG